MQQERYLSEVGRLAEQALIQVEAVRQCEHHNDVLLHNPAAGDEAMRRAYGLASIWLEREVGAFMREDLQDALKSVLDRAMADACPECAKGAR